MNKISGLRQTGDLKLMSLNLVKYILVQNWAELNQHMNERVTHFVLRVKRKITGQMDEISRCALSRLPIYP